MLKRFFIFLFILSFSSFTFLPDPNESKAVVIKNVTLIPMDKEEVIENQMVLISDGQIKAIGQKLKIPKGSTIIDGKGKYLMPGMADMHCHMPGQEGEPYDLNEFLFLNLSRGVTTVRSMRGNPEHLKIREKIMKGELQGPNLYLSSPVITWDKSFDLQKAKVLIPQYKKEGYDFIKYLTGVSPELYDSISVICKKEGIKLAGHAPPSGLKGAIKAQQSSIEHISAFINAYREDSIGFPDLIREMAQKKLFNCPDVYWYYVYFNQLNLDHLKKKEGLQYVPSDFFVNWNEQLQIEEPGFMDNHEINKKYIGTYLKNLKLMNDSGVPLLVSGGDGAYIVPGFSMLEELRIFVDAGLTPYQALKAATSNAADYFGEKDQWGVLKPKTRADIVLLSENPLENIENMKKIEGVMVRGKWISKSEIDQRLKEIEEKYKRNE
jgi:hypothetical protein